MALEAGTKLGPYEILSPLGAGGMGEVYLASDSKLDRRVAIKVLPQTMTRDKERVARFEREAKLLASLNHPNIAAIHGFDESDGNRFLVMEYVEGDTLGSHLSNGPIAVEEALEIAKQIAEALEAAHGQGVVHRDLKPANVMLRQDGTVKVLDFGLAKAIADEPSGAEVANSPTITANYTRPGVVLGTAAYMSPEQARGRALDKRTDIWSFGIILFECLTGETLFLGETATDSMGAIMHKDPEWSLLPPNTPPTIQLLLRRCLTKDRKRRLHDIADARIELENALVDPTSTSLGLARAAMRTEKGAGLRNPVALLLVLTVVLAIGLAYSLTALNRATQPVSDPIVYLNAQVSPSAALGEFPGAPAVLSPDGTRIACVVNNGTTVQLYTRRLDQQELTAVSSTEGASQPFFSPDGKWIGFFAERKLKRVSVSGGTPMSLCEAPGGSNRGASWGDDGMMYFAPTTTNGIWRVPESGGLAEPFTELSEHERSHRWPFALPKGKGLLITVQEKGVDFNESNIEHVDVKTRERRILHRGGSYASYLPTGYLTFARQGTIYATAFDLDSLQLTGSPVPVLEGIRTDLRNGGADLAFSQTGLLVYRDGGQVVEDSSVVWVDRTGNTTTLIERLGNYSAPALSPDGNRLALGIWESASSVNNLWIYDIERGTLSRLTFSEDMDFYPQWSPDGTQIYFTSTREASVPNVYVKPSDGTGAATRITNSTEPQILRSVSPDGQTLLLDQENAGSNMDIMAINFDGEGAVRPILQTPFKEGYATLSPDGHWIAYQSDESGKNEVYVRPFSGAGGKWQISTAGGSGPLWAKDGKELFYRQGDTMMSVAVEAQDASIRAGTPAALFELTGGDAARRHYDVTADGQRFVAVWRVTPERKVDRSHLRFIFNWFDEVAERVSGK